MELKNNTDDVLTQGLFGSPSHGESLLSNGIHAGLIHIDINNTSLFTYGECLLRCWYYGQHYYYTHMIIEQSRPDKTELSSI